MESPALALRKEIVGEVEKGLVEAVLPALGLSGRALRLHIPAFGLSSLVFLAEVEGDAGFAVRVGRGPADRKQLGQRVVTERFWRERALPTPRVLHVDLREPTRAATGFYFLCEERVDGSNAVSLDSGSEGFAAVGRAFAKIHGVERRFHHGSFQQPRFGRFARRLAVRHQGWARALTREEEVAPDLAERHQRFLDGFPLRRCAGPFQLLHRRCTESDVMVDVRGKGWVLEPQRCGFGCYLTDLVRIERRICGGDADSIASLHKGYFDAVAPARRDHYDALAPVFRADLHLANAYRWARKRRQGHPDGQAEFAREFARYEQIVEA